MGVRRRKQALVLAVGLLALGTGATSIVGTAAAATPTPRETAAAMRIRMQAAATEARVPAEAALLRRADDAAAIDATVPRYVVLPIGPSGASDQQLAVLRACESGGNYGIVSAGGLYRGAYQFDQQTWDSVASRWFPHLAGVDPAATSPAEQDAMARALHSERGWQPWPTCARGW